MIITKGASYVLVLTLIPEMIGLFSQYFDLIIDYIPIKSADPHCQFAQIGSSIVDDGFIHVVPKTNALRCRRSRQVPRHQHAAISGLLDGISRKANVIPIRIAGGMISLKWENTSNIEGFFPHFILGFPFYLSSSKPILLCIKKSKKIVSQVEIDWVKFVPRKIG